MKKTSWEIILAGFIFIGISFYLIGNASNGTSETRPKNPADSIRINILDGETHLIEIEKLTELEKLKELHSLSNLEELKNLEQLKALATFMPAEVKKDFIQEIDKAIEEMDKSLLNVQVDTDNGLITIDKISEIKPGSWDLISPGVYAFVDEFDASQLENAQISLPFGSISITGTDDENAKLVIEASGQISSKEDLESRINAHSEITAKNAVFEIKPLSQNQNIHLQATLNIPKNINVIFKTEAGHINSSNITGNQEYQTGGGHINLEQLSGHVEAQTEGGHINISDSRGELKLISEGGHIRASGSEGNITLQTSGGNLQTENVSGSLDASTKAGNIELGLLNITEKITAKTGAGSISIWLPPSLNADIEADGNSVEIGSELNFTGTNSAGEATGKIGNGGAIIQAETDYGNIIIRVDN